jgi:hypothetical protein
MLFAIELFLFIFTIATTYYIVDWCANARYSEGSGTWTFRGYHVKGNQINIAYVLAAIVCLEL